MPRTSESFDKDLGILAADPASALHDATQAFRKNGALANGDFAGQAEVGSFAVNTANADVYVCNATNGTTTAVWELVGLQA